VLHVRLTDLHAAHQNGGGDKAIFRFFKMAAAAILDFQKFLTVRTVKKVKLHQHAKFHRNRSNRGRDM